MELKGARQDLGKSATRRRSGAFPFELAYRLISMFSVKGDTVVDPFLGTGTTLRAAAAAGRDSIGYEIEAGFRPDIFSDLAGLTARANQRIRSRIEEHMAFIEQRRAAGRDIKHLNRTYRFPVVTRQEIDLLLNPIAAVSPAEHDRFHVTYSEDPCHAPDPQRSMSTGVPAETKGQLLLF